MLLFLGGFESEESRDKHLATIKAGRQLCRMRQTPCAQNLVSKNNLFATNNNGVT
jgi:hypothetical protein